MDVGSFGGGNNLGVAGLGIGVKQVRANGVVEKVRFLRHHANVVRQRI
jgi:hypothetical protein